MKTNPAMCGMAMILAVAAANTVWADEKPTKVKEQPAQPVEKRNLGVLPPACGPGDKGGYVKPENVPMNNGCKAHDKDYAAAGASAKNNAPFMGTRASTQADEKLRSAAHEAPGAPARMVETYESAVIASNKLKFAAADKAKEAKENVSEKAGKAREAISDKAQKARDAFDKMRETHKKKKEVR